MNLDNPYIHTSMNTFIHTRMQIHICTCIHACVITDSKVLKTFISGVLTAQLRNENCFKKKVKK